MLCRIRYLLGLGGCTQTDNSDVIRQLENNCLADHGIHTIGITSRYINQNDLSMLSPINDQVGCQNIHTLANEFYKGAYMFIADNGATYQQWISSTEYKLNLRDGLSSHASIDSQYSYNSHYLGEMLFGTREIDGVKGTWVQLEAYSLKPTQFIQHMCAYVYHKITGLNIGPYGTSKYTEEKPLTIEPDQENVLRPEDILILHDNDVLAPPSNVPQVDIDPIASLDITNDIASFLPDLNHVHDVIF